MGPFFQITAEGKDSSRPRENSLRKILKNYPLSVSANFKT